MRLSETPFPALVCGLGGTIPFVFLSIGVYVFPYEWKLIALYNLLNYSVIVLSFLGAVHWGVAIYGKNKNSKVYVWSVIPALASWFILMGFTTDYIIIILFLILCFAVTYYVDLLSTRKSIFPAWYLRLRKFFTIVVFICLGFVAIAINNQYV